MASDSPGSGEIRELAEPERSDRARESPLDRAAEADPADLYDPREEEKPSAGSTDRAEPPDYAAETKDYSDFAEAARRFKPDGANLPDLSVGDAAHYIRTNADQRPWLKSAANADLDAQRVIAAVDQGSGHALERHEGYANEVRLERRVAALEDPAQLDPELRAEGMDSVNPQKLHYCKDTATAIESPEAFAAVVAQGIRHPDVRAVLDRPREPHEKPPGLVEIPIDELLGERGYQHCIGYRLLPINGDIKAARDNREAWAKTDQEQREQMIEPQTAPILTEEFRGGTIAFVFCRTPDYQHWEVRSMYPAPRKGNEHQS